MTGVQRGALAINGRDGGGGVNGGPGGDGKGSYFYIKYSEKKT